jgi:hypothetical protein
VVTVSCIFQKFLAESQTSSTRENDFGEYPHELVHADEGDVGSIGELVDGVEDAEGELDDVEDRAELDILLLPNAYKDEALLFSSSRLLWPRLRWPSSRSEPELDHPWDSNESDSLELPSPVMPPGVESRDSMRRCFDLMLFMLLKSILVGQR